jgi:hypothetical protein
MVASMSQVMANLPTFQFPLSRLSVIDLESTVQTLQEIGKNCELPVISASADVLSTEIGRVTKKPDGSLLLANEEFARVRGALLQLQHCVRVELGTRSALIFDAKSTSLWEAQGLPSGADFRTKFATAQYDMDEAAKCLAVGRGTAAVFHLMRVMETGLRAVHECLGISVALVGNNRNWGSILNRVRDAIANKGKWPEKDLFQEIYALLDSVKDAWRNPTLHVGEKKTTEEAEHIFAMVSGFMKKLASRMDESGEPKA